MKRFHTFCAQGLDENLAYPSHVVIIDADGDGVCSEGDVAELYQMYGWVDEVSVTTTTKRLRPVTSEPNVWGHSMCAYYIR